MRERVERQRSVQAAPSSQTTENNNSLEGLNLEGRSKENMLPTKVSVERLDTQVTTLHNDVAALSMEVRRLAMMGMNKLATLFVSGSKCNSSSSGNDLFHYEFSVRFGALSTGAFHSQFTKWSDRFYA